MISFTKRIAGLLLPFTLLLLSGFTNTLHAQAQLTNLPTFYITTDSLKPIVDKITWIPGKLVVKSSVASETIDSTILIRGRGNSTWNMAKKPYRIKFNKKTSLLGLPAKEKNWVLLANHADKTLMRNALAYYIGRILGFDFTPSTRFADLYLNGTFLGNYMVTDQVEVAPTRIAIDEQIGTDTVSPAITGGYLLEIDGFATTEPVWFTSDKGLKITVKSPDSEVINKKQLAYIKNYISEFETRLFSTNFKDPVAGYRARVDTTSLINWYIACELTGNSDSFWSTYIYKKRQDDKLYFGPMWDYDIAFNNDNRLSDAEKLLMRQNAFNPRAWIERFYQDEWFQKAVLRRWNKLVADNLSGKLTTFITETATLLDQSQQKNFQKWNVLNTRVYNEQFLFSTYAEGVDYLKFYIPARINLLSFAFANPVVDLPSEPFVAENKYYMVMNKQTNNVIDITNESTAPNALLVLWGAKQNEDGQLWIINPLGNDLFRFVNKRSKLAIAGNGKGNNMIQVPINDSDNSQKWKITPVGTGNAYGIVNYKSGYVMDNAGNSYANGTKAIEWDNNITTYTNQQWYLLKMADIPTGLKPVYEQNADFEIYPNPVTGDNLVVRFAQLPDENLNLKISTITGIQVYSGNVNSMLSGFNSVNIPVGNLRSGIYFITVGNSNEIKVTRKLIISHNSR